MHTAIDIKYFLVFSILSLPFILITFWAIIDLIRAQTKAIYTKFLWLVVVVLIPYLGGICYLLFGRKRIQRHNL